MKLVACVIGSVGVAALLLFVEFLWPYLESAHDSGKLLGPVVFLCIGLVVGCLVAGATVLFLWCE
jgi:hypothetical protein